MRLHVFRNSKDIFWTLTNKRSEFSLYLVKGGQISVTSKEDKEIVLRYLKKNGIRYGLEGFNRKKKEVLDEIQKGFIWFSMKISIYETLGPDFHKEMKKKGLVRTYRKERK